MHTDQPNPNYLEEAIQSLLNGGATAATPNKPPSIEHQSTVIVITTNQYDQQDIVFIQEADTLALVREARLRGRIAMAA